jgi:hypothetical protein
MKLRRLIFAIIIILAVAAVDLTVQLHAQMAPVPAAANDVVKAYRLTHPTPYADSPYWSKAFVMEIYNLTEHLTDQDYWIMDDYKGTWYNVTDGRRLVIGVPAHYDHTIWLFGNSGIFDPYVPDAYTAASQLQALANAAGYRYRVVNLGVDAASIVSEYQRLKYTAVKPGDVVVFIDGAIDVQGNTPVSQYWSSVAKAKVYALGLGAAWYHFVQPYASARLAPLGGNQISVPPTMFVDDGAHMNEHGDAIAAHAIYAAIWRSL